MARIVGVDLPKNKRGEIGLTYIYGIGRSTARKILDEAGISYDLKVQDWSDEQVGAIRSKIADMGIKVEGECRSVVQLNIKRLMDIGCYRGIRHRLGLPVRGQSTKNNARTRKSTFLMNEILGDKDRVRMEDGAIVTIGATTFILHTAEAE